MFPFPVFFLFFMTRVKWNMLKRDNYKAGVSTRTYGFHGGFNLFGFYVFSIIMVITVPISRLKKRARIKYLF